MLAALVGLAVVVRSFAALSIEVPWIAPDEAAYALLGRGVWEHGSLTILGGPTPYVSALYPALAGLPLRLGGFGAGYDVLRVLQTVVLCSTAVVVYAWARSLVAPPWALAGAALTLLLPGLTYAGTLTAEVLFVPLATLAAWLAVRALVAPTRASQALLLGALAACLLTRAEANVLAFGVVGGAIVCGRLRELAPTWIAFALVLVGWLALGGGPPIRTIGGYSGTAAYTPLRIVEYVAYHAGDLLLVCAVLPLCGVVLLALTRPPEPALRASLAVILATVAVAVVEVGAFAAGHAGRLLERELLFTLPPLLVGFVAWLARGAPRPRGATIAVAAIAFAGLLALPVGTLADTDALTDNPGLVPLIRVTGPQAYGLTALVAVVACALLLWVPRRRRWILPLVVGGAFLGASFSAAQEFAHESRIAKARLGPTPAWVDRAATAPAGYLYDGGPEWSQAWSGPLWNDRLGTVLDLTSTAAPGPLPQTQLRLVGDDGALRAVDGGAVNMKFLVAPAGLHLDGVPIATRPSASGSPALVLWRLGGPARVTSWTQGLGGNGDLASGGTGTLTVYRCGRGVLHVVATGRDDTHLALARDGATIAATELWPQGTWEQWIPTGPRRGRCTFSLTSSGLVNMKAFAWAPS